MDIIPTEGKSGSRQHWGSFAIALTLGGSLLGMAPARVQSALLTLEPEEVISEAEAGTAIAVDVLDGVSRQVLQAADLDLSVHAWELAGRAQVLLALYYGPGTANGLVALADARNSFRHVLSDAPLAPRDWHRLAYAEFASQRLREAAGAWHMSVRTGPFDPALLPVRLESGLVLYPYMDVRSRQAFAAQVRLYAGWNIHALIKHVLQINAVDAVRPFLVTQPAVLAEFDRLLPLLKAKQ